MSFMLSFWQKAPATWQDPPAVPDGHRVYAVGDVHGQDHLLAGTGLPNALVISSGYSCRAASHSWTARTP